MFPKLNSLPFTFPIPQKGFTTWDGLFQLLFPGHGMIFSVPFGHCLRSGPTASAITAFPQAWVPLHLISHHSWSRGPSSSSAITCLLRFKHFLFPDAHRKAQFLLLVFKALQLNLFCQTCFSYCPYQTPCSLGTVLLSQLHGFANRCLSAGMPYTPTSPKVQPKCCLPQDVSEPR